MSDETTAAGDQILASRDGPLARIVINNPAKRNAVSLDMWRAIAAHLEAFAGDPALRVVLLAGAGGKAFVSGADISKFESERADPGASEAYGAATERVFALVEAFERPVIAQIDGFCMGGGVALAAACDLRICGRGAQFAVPAARLGVGYGHESVQRLVGLIGPAVALEMLATARRFSADEALAMGLVNRVVPDHDVAAAAAELAQRVAAGAPLTVAAAKAAVRAALGPKTAEATARLDALVAACFASEDYVEGRRAFMDKRPPQFRGR